MKAFDIVTLTVNPALDKSTTFSGLIAEQKIRCDFPQYDAGGGGINVSKAISRLGGSSLCIFTSGGSAGQMIEKLIAEEKIDFIAIPVKNWTRESLVAVDDHTNKQYRFGFPGAEISASEQKLILKSISEHKPQYFVVSGSLNEGLPTDYYAKIAKKAKSSGAKVILDTSGEPLKKALEEGVYLVKPNVGELAKLVGTDRLHTNEVDDAAKTLIDKGQAEIVVVSLGPQGAVLVTKDETHFIPAPNVSKKSTVGAGDSMVGGMTWALSQDKSMKEVVQWGVACGSAATMSEGSRLFQKEDAEKLFGWLEKK